MLDGVEAAQTVARALAGDRQALASLAAAWLRPVYVVALAYLRQPVDAEDLAQDVVVHALSELETCREPARVIAWVLAIARNRAKNALDKRRLREAFAEREAAAPSGSGTASADTGVAAVRRDLLRGLSTLSPVQREVVLLHDLEGWDHAEIAARLGISEVHSRQHLFVARRALRTALAESEAPHDA